MGSEYFNEFQNAHMDYLHSLPAEKKCPCGWYLIEECLAGKGCPACNTDEGRKLQHERIAKEQA
jgi:hypothetical protein